MSLDVTLTATKEGADNARWAIFVRKDGRTKEVTREEWDRAYPDREPCVLQVQNTDEVFSANITHNLTTMAHELGVYEYVWRPEEVAGVSRAGDLIEPLAFAVQELTAHPEYYDQFNPENGWGDRAGLLEFLEEYLAACREWPDATIHACR